MAFLRISILLLALLPLASCLLLFECNNHSTKQSFSTNLLNALTIAAQQAPGDGHVCVRNEAGVNVFGRCTGLHNGPSCADCLANAAATFQKYCGNKKAGVVWHNCCMLRYSTVNFFGIWNAQPMYLFLPSTQDAQIPIQDAVLQLAQIVSNMAVQSGANLFKAVDQPFNGLNIRIMAQCTQDLSTSQCKACLDWLREKIASNCGNKDGCRLYHVSCILRYGTGMFFIS